MQDKAVGTLADVARLDKARQRDRIERVCQHDMGKVLSSPGCGGKTRCDGGDDNRNGEEFVPPPRPATTHRPIAVATATDRTGSWAAVK
jgi:hypothetical protein